VLDFLLKVVVISASGALAPGPLTAATASAGLKKGWRAGLETSIGHTIIELPLVILLSAGVTSFLKNPRAHFFLGIIGGVFLLFFGFSTIRDALQISKPKEPVFHKTPSPLLTGIALTSFNPYFIAWWIGIGGPLIYEAVDRAGYIGIGLLYIFHVWLDYAWLTAIAAISSLGRLQTKIFKWVLITLGGLVIWFGISMLLIVLATH